MFIHISEWLKWADSTGLFALLATILVLIHKYLRPLILARIEKETNQVKLQTLKIVDDLAQAIIPELAILASLSNEDRKSAAIKFIQDKLEVLELSLTEETISAKVEEAYQQFKKTSKG